MAILGFGTLGLAAGYAVLAVVAVLIWCRRAVPAHSSRLPPATLLKPLCGAEPGLYENLRSFCLQDYPEFQIVFGVRDAADPALAVARRLAAEFPSVPIDIVVDPQLHGSNCKTSNLINMFTRARHDVLVMADSDAFVGPDYLKTVTAPLLDERVGMVTCIYRSVPTARIWSRLGAMYVNEWYVPSVLLAWLFGHQGYASGQTLSLRRDTLQAVGGLPAIANHLAEDNKLCELIRGVGLRVVLASYVVQTEHHEPNLNSLTRHELRWMRTIRVIRPRSFCLMFLTFSVPLALVGILFTSQMTSSSIMPWLLFGITCVARVALHFWHRLHGERLLLSDLWLLPSRDLLICWIWWRSFFTSRVSWRGSEFNVDFDGIMRRLS